MVHLVSQDEDGMDIGWIELLGFATGVVTVVLLIRENEWGWPVGIVNNLFLIVVFTHSRLYAATGLQALYIPLAILGWHNWHRGGGQKKRLAVSNAPVRLLLLLATASVVSAAALASFLRTVRDPAPFRDATATVLSLNAQYLMTRKAMESWYVWIAADVIYVSVYFGRGLYWTVGLYVIFMAMSITGWREWNRSRKQVARENL
jgi:nicotinamide mononucleotide transporter